MIFFIQKPDTVFGDRYFFFPVKAADDLFKCFFAYLKSFVDFVRAAFIMERQKTTGVFERPDDLSLLIVQGPGLEFFRHINTRGIFTQDLGNNFL